MMRVSFPLLLSLLAASCVNSFIMRSYDAVNHLEYDSMHEFSKTFFNMEESRASMNIIVAYTTPECKEQISDNAALYGSQRHAGTYSFVSATVVVPQSEFPFETNNCAEIHFYRFNSIITEPTESTTDFDLHTLTSWVHHRMAVNGFFFTNHFEFPIDIFWYDESKSPMKQESLETGQTTTIGTHLGHIFVARRQINKDAGWSEENPIVDWISVKEDGCVIIIYYKIIDYRLYLYVYICESLYVYAFLCDGTDITSARSTTWRRASTSSRTPAWCSPSATLTVKIWSRYLVAALVVVEAVEVVEP